MSDVRTQQTVLRGELYEVFGGRPRLIRAFENLLFDVSTTLPDSMATNSQDASDDTAQVLSVARNAEGMAQQALSIATGLADGPPMPAATPGPDTADDWIAVVMQLLARVARLEADLANLKEGPTP